MRKRGWKVEVEPRIKRGSTYVKPDLVCYKPGKVVVADPTVVADCSNWENEWQEKRRRYDQQDVKDYAIRRMDEMYGPQEPPTFDVGAITINWRGAWSDKSYKFARTQLKVSNDKLSLWTIDMLVDNWHTWKYVKEWRTDA